MDRRRFLLTSLAGALAAPLAAEVQPTDKAHRLALRPLGIGITELPITRPRLWKLMQRARRRQR
jgi:hypothetical protein